LIAGVFAAFYVWAALYVFRPLGDPDIWWHLAAGRWMLQHGGAPRVDPFSFTALGTRWTDSYWLYEMILYSIQRLSGYGGVILFNSLLVVGGLFFLERSLVKRGLPWTLRLGALALTLAAAEPRGYGWTENASTISFLFLSVLFWCRAGARDKGGSDGGASAPCSVLLPPLFAVWANLHRGCLLGLAVLALEFIEESRGRIWRRPRALGLLALCALATLVNPYGFGLYRHAVLDVRLSPLHTYNWARTPFRHLEIFWAVFAVFWISRAWNARRPLSSPGPRAGGGRGRGEWLVPLFLGWVAARHAWGVRFFVLYAVADLASGAWDWARGEDKGARLGFLNGGPVVALPVFAFLLWAIAAQPARALIDGGRVPAGACDVIESRRIEGPFYNDYGFGGYFIWRFAGKIPVFIDGRYPAVEGYIPLYERLMKAKLGNPEDWRRFLDSYGVRSALVGYPPPQTPLARFALYFPKSRWKLVYQGDVALLFVRRR
jgi:hypothetical protein